MRGTICWRKFSKFEAQTLTLIYDEHTPLVGVGEATTIITPMDLHFSLGYDLIEHSNETKAIPKRFIKYENWGINKEW